MGMKKLIFYRNNFFGSGHFLIHEIWKKDRKIARAKKVVNYAKEFLKSVYTGVVFYDFGEIFKWLAAIQEKNFFIENW